MVVFVPVRGLLVHKIPNYGNDIHNRDRVLRFMTESERGGGSEGARQRLCRQLMFADSDYSVCEVIVARLLVLWVFNAMVVVVWLVKWNGAGSRNEVVQSWR